MTRPIIVVNPNSNAAVTEGLDSALEPFRLKGGPKIECLTLMEGPFGIESQLDSDSVILPLAQLVQSRDDAGAFVIACYSDPGLDACRSVSAQPIFGIQESGVLSAMARADQFGVLAISEASIVRHRRFLARMGVLGRLAGEFSLNISVEESARGTNTLARLVKVGQELKCQGAGALILGCAGMARHRAGLEAELSVPVIDPTQAAVAMAMGTLMAG
ncbi:MAG: aspartate/glutamate racemase family protein [Paracoccaceae bacterium]|nr:aspartate/glutamate racemase family protein [Paracoccaceae bacterium]